jgi:outer membrane protein assembly factor BamB
MKKLPFLAIYLFVLSCVSQPQKEEQKNISQWRGINRDGVYNETGLLNQWPENGPELLWFTEEIGSGFAEPSVLNDKIFVNGEIDSTAYLFVFDLYGKLLWKSPNGPEFMGEGYASNYPGARSTPTILDNLVYATTGHGRIACFETSGGAEKWAVEMVKDLGGWENEFGYSESVAVEDQNVYCFPGGTETNIAALDRFTGKTVWTSKALGDTTSFCSPILVDLPTRKILVTFGRNYLFAIDCKTGELLGSYKLEGFQYDGEHCNTPIYIDGYIYMVVAEENGKGAIKLAISSDGKNIKEVWTNKQIRNGFGGFVVVGNNLFTTVQANWLKSVEINSGIVEDSVKTIFGSVIFADQKFICYGMNGEVSLINYAQNKFEVAGKFKIGKGTKEHFSHPVVANGVMYIRHGKALMAYKIK